MIDKLRERWFERRAANAYWRRVKRSRKAWLASERYAEIKACSHENRRLNPESRPHGGWAQGEICNDCGIGITRRITPLRIETN